MTKRRSLALGAAVALGFGSLFAASPALAVEAPPSGAPTVQPLDGHTDPATFPTISEISDGDHFAYGEVPTSISGTYTYAKDDDYELTTGAGNLTIQIVKGSEGEGSLLLHDEFDVSGGTWSYDFTGVKDYNGNELDFANDEYMIMIGVPEGISHRGTEVRFTVGADGDDDETEDPVDPQELPTISEISDGDHFAYGDVPTPISGTYTETSDDGQLTIQIVKGSEGEGSLLFHDEFDVSGGTWSYDFTGVKDYNGNELDFANDEYMIMIGVPEGISHRGTEARFTVGADEAPDVEVTDPDDGTELVDGTVFDVSEAPDHATGTGVPGATIDMELTGPVNASGTYTVAEDRSWSAPYNTDNAPLPVGDYTLVITQTVEGQEPQTISVAFSVVEDEAAEYADVTITDIVNGGFYSGPIGSASGNGEPGATLTIETGGDQFEEPVSHEAQVAADGTWSVQFDQPFQSSPAAWVDVQQEVDGEQTSTASAEFSVFSPILITSISTNDHFTGAEAPSSAQGTIDASLVGKDVLLSFSVSFEGQVAEHLPADEIDVTVDEEGNWNADFGAALPNGDYTFTASVTFTEEELEARNHIDDASVAFTVGSGAGNDGENDGSTGTGDGKDHESTGSDELAVTGGSSTMPYAFGAAGLILAGASSLLIARRKRA